MKLDEAIDCLERGGDFEFFMKELELSDTFGNTLLKWLKELKKLREDSRFGIKGTKGVGGHPPVKMRAKCPTCDGIGCFGSGSTECPTCDGVGKVKR